MYIYDIHTCLHRFNRIHIHTRLIYTYIHIHTCMHTRLIHPYQENRQYTNQSEEA